MFVSVGVRNSEALWLCCDQAVYYWVSVLTEDRSWSLEDKHCYNKLKSVTITVAYTVVCFDNFVPV